MRTRLDLFVLSALGVYRLWRLLARDEITQRPRETLYNRWPPTANRAAGVMRWDRQRRQMVLTARGAITADSKRRSPRVSAIAAMWDCPWCLGTWLSAATAVAVDLSFGLTWPVLWWLALATTVGLLGRIEGGWSR